VSENFHKFTKVFWAKAHDHVCSLIYHSSEQRFIVLEDLAVEGFGKCQKPHDYETSKLIFERIAVFHAASFYLLENVRKTNNAVDVTDATEYSTKI
jgi:Ecdysteroid kinase-like family